MEISSIPIINKPEGRKTVKNIGAPAALSAGAVMLATRAPKGADNPFKFSKRLGMAGKAAVATVAVLGLINLNPEKVKAGVDKVKSFVSEKFGKQKPNEEAKNAEAMKPEAEAMSPEAMKPEAEAMNPVAPNNAETKASDAEAKAIEDKGKELDDMADKIEAEAMPAQTAQVQPQMQQAPNFFMNGGSFPFPPVQQ